MSYYPALKQRLTCREVAPRYGLKVNASGMALCPFYDEHSPSLKLSRGFHCFGCGAQGAPALTALICAVTWASTQIWVGICQCSLIS